MIGPWGTAVGQLGGSAHQPAQMAAPSHPASLSHFSGLPYFAGNRISAPVCGAAFLQSTTAGFPRGAAAAPQGFAGVPVAAAAGIADVCSPVAASHPTWPSDGACLLGTHDWESWDLDAGSRNSPSSAQDPLPICLPPLGANASEGDNVSCWDVSSSSTECFDVLSVPSLGGCHQDPPAWWPAPADGPRTSPGSATGAEVPFPQSGPLPPVVAPAPSLRPAVGTGDVAAVAAYTGRPAALPSLMVAVLDNKAGEVGVALFASGTTCIEILQFADTVLYSKTMSYLFSSHFKHHGGNSREPGDGLRHTPHTRHGSRGTVTSTPTSRTPQPRGQVGRTFSRGPASSNLCEILVAHTAVQGKLVQTLLRYFNGSDGGTSGPPQPADGPRSPEWATGECSETAPAKSTNPVTLFSTPVAPYRARARHSSAPTPSSNATPRGVADTEQFPVRVSSVHRRYFNEAKGAKRLMELMSQAVTLEASQRPRDGSGVGKKRKRASCAAREREHATCSSSSSTLMDIMDPSHYLCCAAANALLYVLDTVYTGTLPAADESRSCFLPSTVQVRYVTLEHYVEIGRQTAKAIHLIGNSRLERAAPPPCMKTATGSQQPQHSSFTPAHSLIASVDFTISPMGRRLLRGSIVQPLRDIPSILARYDCVEQLVGKSVSGGHDGGLTERYSSLEALRHALRPFAVEVDFERVLGVFSYEPVARDVGTVEQRLLALVSLWTLLRAVVDIREVLLRQVILPRSAHVATATSAPYGPTGTAADDAVDLPTDVVGATSSALSRSRAFSATHSSARSGSSPSDSSTQSDDESSDSSPACSPASCAPLLQKIYETLEACDVESLCVEIAKYLDRDVVRLASASEAAAATAKRRGNRPAVPPALEQVQLCFLVHSSANSNLGAARDRYSAIVDEMMAHCSEIKQRWRIPSLRVEYDHHRSFHFRYDARHEAAAAAAVLDDHDGTDGVSGSARREPLLLQRYSGGSHYSLYHLRLLQQQQQQQHGAPRSLMQPVPDDDDEAERADWVGAEVAPPGDEPGPVRYSLFPRAQDAAEVPAHVVRGRKVSCTSRRLLLLNHQAADMITAIVQCQYDCVGPLLELLRERMGTLQSCCEAIGLLDMLCAFSVYSIVHRCVRPRLLYPREKKRSASSSKHHKGVHNGCGDTDPRDSGAPRSCGSVAFFPDAVQPTAGPTARAMGLILARPASLGAGGAAAPLPATLPNQGTANTLRWGPLQQGAEENILFITGPNASGKSTILRLIGQLFCLAQAGCFVPVRRCSAPLPQGEEGRAPAPPTEPHLTPCDALLAISLCDVPEDASVSAFQMEVQQLHYVLAAATSQSLVLVDELGRRTTTLEGSALAWATVEELAQHIRCRAAFATHFIALTRLAELDPTPEGTWGVANYHLAVTTSTTEGVSQEQDATSSSHPSSAAPVVASDTTTTRPRRTLMRLCQPVIRYSYLLVRGACQVDHYGIRLARAVGFFQPALKRAEALLTILSGSHSSADVDS